MKVKAFLINLSLIFLCSAAHRSFGGLENGREQLLNFAGCFLTDYNFAEKERLHESYSEIDFQKNAQRYDASAIEWIDLVEDEGNRLLFQRIMLIDRGQTEPYIFKHHSEQWLYEPAYFYEYQGDGRYIPRDIAHVAGAGSWRRDVSSLDDGPRYQCVARWKKTEKRNEPPTWVCENYSPMPGREFRDMNRNDYHGLQRRTQIQSHRWGWKELQWNQKVREEAGHFVSLVSELGNTTYTRIDDRFCMPAKEFWAKRKDFWKLVRLVWADVLDGQSDYASYTVRQQKIDPIEPDMTARWVPRYEAIHQIAESFSAGFMAPRNKLDEYEGFKASDSSMLTEKIRLVIDEYRK